MIPIPKDRLAVFINHPSEAKDQALEEWFSPYSILWVYGCFQLIGQLPVTMSSKANSQK